MTDDRPKLIVITGPTASGKSSLAIELAHLFGGEIVNADSMQVYRHMNVGTAKPSIIERRGIPHHLMDVVEPDEDFNAAIYRSFAEPLLREIEERQKICFVVGGTGLYIKSLLGGLLKCPPTDHELRKKLFHECEEYGSFFLHERLKVLDPESALRIHPHDKVRILRALEIINLTNKPLSSLIRKHGFKDRPYRALKICLQMDRDQLYRRINERTLAMIEEGLVMETEVLLRKGYSPDLKPMKTLGYRHIVQFLEGESGLDETIRQIQRDTRRYAKRQLTWFKSDHEMVWAEPQRRDIIVKNIQDFI
jgi:tRNA dimethylallyltransferase